MIDLVSRVAPAVRDLHRQLVVLRQAQAIFEEYDDRHLALAVQPHIAALERDVGASERWPAQPRTARFRSSRGYWALGFTRAPRAWAVQCGRWTYVRTSTA